MILTGYESAAALSLVTTALIVAGYQRCFPRAVGGVNSSGSATGLTLVAGIPPCNRQNLERGITWYR